MADYDESAGWSAYTSEEGTPVPTRTPGVDYYASVPGAGATKGGVYGAKSLSLSGDPYAPSVQYTGIPETLYAQGKAGYSGGSIYTPSAIDVRSTDIASGRSGYGDTRSWVTAPSLNEQNKAKANQAMAAGISPSWFNPAMLGAAPVMEAVPTFTAPTFDETKIQKYANKFASPYNRELGRAISQAIVRAMGTRNPILSRYLMGGTMPEYGQELGKIQSKAYEQGKNAYQYEYGNLMDAAKTSYMANVAAVNARNAAQVGKQQALFNAALSAFGQGG